MRDGMDMSELSNFDKHLMELASKKMPRETRRFLQKEGNKLRTQTRRKARQKVKKQTGNYLRRIKRGKVYKYQGDELSVRVYNSAPHAHLIEKGHRIVGKDGSEHGFARGANVFRDASQEYESQFTRNCEDFLANALEEGLS